MKKKTKKEPHWPNPLSPTKAYGKKKKKKLNRPTSLGPKTYQKPPPWFSIHPFNSHANKHHPTLNYECHPTLWCMSSYFFYYSHRLIPCCGCHHLLSIIWVPISIIYIIVL
jgi:hypothetical protein